ncbi:hypothetical protein [Candidatus Accumulibacter sp. ACC003]|uniref:hypothetical protein n=1 Tax=Candidatus Accumulibacter sp. ACC003 TaxID=2823334 RepID=UPI0025C1B8F4|nr:hypothetical protein [Candidatus Accumulibacter sp. ACC003]
MNKLVVFLIAASTVVSGCMVYDTPYQDRGQHRGDDYQRDRGHDGASRHGDSGRDRDGDGVRNSQDRHPDNPSRY